MASLSCTKLWSHLASAARPGLAGLLTINAQQGQANLIKKARDAVPSTVRVTGTAAPTVKKMGSRTVGP